NDALDRARQSRREALRALPKTVLGVLQAAGIGLGIAIPLLLAVIPLLLWIAHVDGVTASGWYIGLGNVLKFVVNGLHLGTVALLSPFGLTALLIAWIIAAYRAGRKSDT